MAQGQREAETFQRDGGGGAVQAGTVYAGGCGRGSYPRLYGRLQRQQVCSRQLFREAIHNEFTQPQRWQTNEINDIMNQLIRDGTLKGWRYFDSPRRFPGEYGTQKGWERVPDVNEGVSTNDGFHQMGLRETSPFDDGTSGE